MQEIRTVAPDEFLRWLRAESRAHGNRLDHDPETLRPHFDLGRTVARVEIQGHDQALASARHFLSLLGQGRSGLTDPGPAGPIETAS